jgi:hypothetical protein
MRNDYELEMVSSDWINPDTGNNTGIGSVSQDEHDTSEHFWVLGSV